MGAGKSTLIFVSSPAAMREFKKGNQPDIFWDHVGPHEGSKGQELSEHPSVHSEKWANASCIIRAQSGKHFQKPSVAGLDYCPNNEGTRGMRAMSDTGVWDPVSKTKTKSLPNKEHWARISSIVAFAVSLNKIQIIHDFVLVISWVLCIGAP